MKQTIIFIFILISSFLHSQGLVYTPISPFFGGDAYNYQQILASAVAQNDFTDEQTQFKAPTALENFTNSVKYKVT